MSTNYTCTSNRGKQPYHRLLWIQVFAFHVTHPTAQYLGPSCQNKKDNLVHVQLSNSLKNKNFKKVLPTGYYKFHFEINLLFIYLNFDLNDAT